MSVFMKVHPGSAGLRDRAEAQPEVCPPQHPNKVKFPLLSPLELLVPFSILPKFLWDFDVVAINLSVPLQLLFTIKYISL